ncbi:MAG: hypothetical protein R8K46_10850 [Mariprofundaceae bacterium]
MMENDRDKQFIDDARHVLDESAAALDELTIARLKAARLRALEQRPTPRLWLWPAGGLATAATVALVFWLTAVQPPEVSSGMDDFDILAAEESFEFYAEMDFYDWLESNDIAS